MKTHQLINNYVHTKWMAHYVEVYMQFWSCFKVWLKQNFFDMKDFNCNYNLIHPTFFRWLFQFLPLATIKIQDQPALSTIFHFCISFQTFLGIVAITSSRYSVCQFSGKTNNFEFFAPNSPKSGIRIGNSENQCRNKNEHPRDTLCANFWEKRTTLNFSTQISPKWIKGWKFRKLMAK